MSEPRAAGQHLTAAVSSAGGHITSAAQTVSAGSLLFHLVLALGVVIAVIAVVARIPRGSTRPGLGLGRPSVLGVVGRQSLGKGISVAVVRAGGETYLVGVTPHQVTRLGRLPDVDLASDVALDPARPRWFPDLRRLVHGDSRGSAGLPPPGGPPSSRTFRLAVEQLRERTLRRA